MKTFIKTILLALLHFSCQQEENVSPDTGYASFSFDERDRTNGRHNETPTPAFVLLSVQGTDGDKREEIKLSLFSFGTDYLSEKLELPVGNYQLTQFVVLDASNRVIYATPYEASDLAKYVTDSLPLDFNVTSNGSQVIAEVLPVLEEDKPELFGYVTFSFEIINKRDKVKKVVFHDLFTNEGITTLYFEYENEKVKIVKWEFDFPSAGITRSYVEERFYSTNGDLDSLASSRFNEGTWNLSYNYKDGQLHEIKSNRNDSINTTVTFLEYSGSKPILIENLFGIYGIYEGEGIRYPRYTAFEFDVAGNLVSQKHTDIPGFPTTVHEKRTIFSMELNPLRNLIQTPLPQALEHYDDLAFYFSTNLPSSVEANYPYVDPIHNRITLEYSKDDKGRITQIKALWPDDSSLRYTLDITYY
ncbi:MAG TPA: hypothetical protein VIU13_19550 [Chryseolinea sp.]